MKQALEAARLAGASERMQRQILNNVARILPDFPLTLSPPQMGRIIHKIVRSISKNHDPYLKIKEKSNRLALGIYKKLKRKISHSDDRLLMALELAIAGNIIDYGVKNSLNIEAELKSILAKEDKAIRNKKKATFNYISFKQTLKKAKTILYLGDNAGEVVFDRVLIEEIKRIDNSKRVIYAVKEGPIINDALIDDAHRCGIDKIAEVISSGLDAPGTVLSLCKKKFLKIYNEANMIISKGQGNFESLSNAKKGIFFLFMAKCPVIAKEVGCDVGNINLLYEPAKR